MTFHEKTSMAARTRWRGILMELGIPGDLLTKKQGPCPVCGGRDRFRFDDKEGRGTSYCNTCGARDGMKLALDFTGRPFTEIAPRIDALVGNVKPDSRPLPELSEEDRAKRLREVYLGSRAIEPGDLAHRYLASRHIEELIYPKALRFHPGLNDGDGYVRPALLAMVGVYGAERFSSIHRTFLCQDGSAKAEIASPRRMMPGSLPEGACVALSEWTGGPIGIAEGLETAMSASALFDIPVWSAISANMMEKWTPPPGADEVVIFGDNDASFTGAASAYALAKRLRHELPAEVDVLVKIPEIAGEDWSDVWTRHVEINSQNSKRIGA